VAIPKPSTGSNINMAKLQIFKRNTSKISEFLITYKLYIRIKMRDTIVEEQIQ